MQYEQAAPGRDGGGVSEGDENPKVIRGEDEPSRQRDGED